MKVPIHVQQSGLSNKIFAGSVHKNGMEWLSNKTDVTTEALTAVAEHVLTFGKPVTLTSSEDILTITVTKKEI